MNNLSFQLRYMLCKFQESVIGRDRQIHTNNILIKQKNKIKYKTKKMENGKRNLKIKIISKDIKIC